MSPNNFLQSSCVSKGIIELLEVVNIQHDSLQRTLISLCTFNFARESLFHESPVVQAGQRIANGLTPQCLAQLQIGERQRNLFGGHYCQWFSFIAMWKKIG